MKINRYLLIFNLLFLFLIVFLYAKIDDGFYFFRTINVIEVKHAKFSSPSSYLNSSDISLSINDIRDINIQIEKKLNKESAMVVFTEESCDIIDYITMQPYFDYVTEKEKNIIENIIKKFLKKLY